MTSPTPSPPDTLTRPDRNGGTRLAVPSSLLFAQGAGALGLAAGGTAGPLLIQQLTGSDTFVALPLGLLVVGSGVSAPLVTALMRRSARAVGLLLSYAVAAAGAWLVVLSATSHGLLALLAGSLLLGAGNAAVMLGRYVAADGAPRNRVGAAVSLAMTAVTVGAVVGPALLGPAGSVATSLGLPSLTGLYLLAGIVFPLAAAVTLVLNRATPRTPAPVESDAPVRPAHRFLPLVVLGTANLTMVVVMAVMPADLHTMGWPLATVGVLVAAHIGAMFGPSPVSGWVRDRAGSTVTALVGSGLLVCAAVLSAASAQTGGVVVSVTGLVLLGVGWNFQLIGGTAMLIERTPAASRSRAEGLGELTMGMAAASGTLGLVGPMIELGGMTLVCVVVCALTVVVAAPLVRELRR
jgi:MFS family permease